MTESNKPMLYRCELPVRYGDMDSNQHVNNTRYYQYLEEARILWLDGLGAHRREVGQGLVLLTCTHHFLRPVVHPNTVIVELFAGDVGRTSLSLDHRMFVKGQPELVGQGDVKMVWIDVSPQRPIPVPDSVRIAMGKEPLGET